MITLLIKNLISKVIIDVGNYEKNKNIEAFKFFNSIIYCFDEIKFW